MAATPARPASLRATASRRTHVHHHPHRQPGRYATAFKYATANGSAIAPGDYTAKALTSLSFTAGQTSKTITVTIKGDTVGEPDEQFSVLLSAVTGGTIADGTGTATILNED